MTHDDASGARTELTALIAPAPMTPRVERLTFAAGATVAELLTRAVREGHLSAADLPRTEVLINGHLLSDRVAGLDRVLQAGDLVNIAVTLHGGGGGGGRKNPMQVVLQLAVMVAAAYIGGPMASKATTKAMQIGLKVAAAAVQVGGALAIQAAFASKPERQAEEQRYSLSGQSNQARPGQAMALINGSARVAFDLASSAFTTTVGDDTYITAIYGAHYGPCAVTLEKFGETLLSTLNAGEVELEYFLTPGPRDTRLYPMRVVEDDYTDTLEFDRTIPSPWASHPTAVNAEIVEGDIVFPSGLGFTKEKSGSYVSQEVRGQVQYAPYGTNNWTPAPIVDARTGMPFRDRHGAVMPVGDWYVQGKSKKSLRRTWRFVPAAKGRYDVRVRAWDPENDDPEASTYATMWAAMRTIENKPAVTDEVLSIIVARWKGSKTINGQVPTFSGVVTPICPVLDDDDEWTGDPAVYSEAWKPTSNALAHARYMLTGYPAARPLRADQIDDSFKSAYRLVEQYGWTGSVVLQQDASQQEALDQLGHMGRCAFYHNGRAVCAVSEWEKPAAKQMFGVSNGKDYRYSRIFPRPIHGVMVEFTNLDQDSKPDEVFVPMDGYSLGGGLVDGVMTQPATMIESYTLPFRANQVRAFKEGRGWLAKRFYQSETHAWSAGPDSVVSTFGDRVKVRHPSSLFGQTDCRVQNRIWSGGAVSGVRLSRAVTMEAGKSYALEVRTPGREIRGLTVVTQAGSTRNLVFPVALAVGDAPLKDDLAAFGEFELVTEDVEIIDYGPTSARSVTLLAQPYRFADLLAAETGPIPPLQTRLTARAKSPKPAILQAVGDPAGARVTFAIGGQRTSPVQGFTARWRSTPTAADPSPAWASLLPLDPDQRQLVTPAFPDAQNTAGEIDAEYKVDIEIRTVLANGDISDPGVVSGLLIDRGVPEPRDFLVGGLKRLAPDGSARPVLSISAEPITTGLVQDLVVERRPAGGGDDDWVSAGSALPAKAPYGDFEISGGASYDVSGQWRTADGWLSPRVVRPNIAVPAGSLVANDSQTTSGKTLAQIIADANAVIQPALDDLEARAQATALEAGAATAALFTPGTGVVPRVDALKVQADGTAAALINEASVRQAADVVAAGRLDRSEAKQAMLPNLLDNPKGEVQPAFASWDQHDGITLGYDRGIGSFFNLGANATGASRYLLSKPYLAYAGERVSLSVLGSNSGGSMGNARAQVGLKWLKADFSPATPGFSTLIRVDAAAMNWSKPGLVENLLVPADAVYWQLIVDVPPGHLGSQVSNFMVNSGPVAMAFNDAGSSRELQARTYSLSLSQAGTNASLATLTDRVGVSLQQAVGPVRNPRFSSYLSATGLAEGWSGFAGGAANAIRVNGEGANWAPRFTLAVAQEAGIVQVVTLTPGRWVMVGGGYCRSGNWQGAGVLVQRASNGATVGLLNFAADPDGGGVVGAGGVGERRFTKAFTVTETMQVYIYGMAGWAGLGTVTAKILDVWVCDVYPSGADVREAQAVAETALTAWSDWSATFSAYTVTTNARFTSPTGEVQVAKGEAISQSLANTNQAISIYATATDARFTSPTGEVQVAKAGAISQSLANTNQAISTYDQSTTASFGGLRALTTTMQGAIAGLGGKLVAWLKFSAAAGGNEAKVEIVADDGSSLVRMVAKAISLANTVGGIVIDVLKIVGGEVFFGAPVSIDVAGKRLTIGPGFGSGSDLVWWFGPSAISVATMTKVNGHFALATDGKVYYGTAELGTGGAVDAVLSKSAEAANLTPNSGTHTAVAQIDFGGVVASDLVEGWLGFSGTGATLSGAGSWVGGWEIVEQTTAGGSTHVVATGGLQVDDAGGGFLEFQVTPNGPGVWSALAPRNLNGAVRYALRLWRISGPNLGGDGVTAVLRVRRTP